MVVEFPQSAKSSHKSIKIAYYEESSDSVRMVSSHRLLFTPCFLPSQLLWIKLENGLSIFDNETFVDRSDDSLCLQDFFLPFTIVHDNKIFTFYQYWHFLNKNFTMPFKELKLMLKADFITILSANTASILHINQWGKNLFKNVTKNQKALIENVIIEIA